MLSLLASLTFSSLNRFEFKTSQSYSWRTLTTVALDWQTQIAAIRYFSAGTAFCAIFSLQQLWWTPVTEVYRQFWSTQISFMVILVTSFSFTTFSVAQLKLLTISLEQLIVFGRIWPGDIKDLNHFRFRVSYFSSFILIFLSFSFDYIYTINSVTFCLFPSRR